MKLKCGECGAWIQTGDDDTERAKTLLAAHVVAQHGSVEARHTKTLTKCLAVLQTLAGGERVSKQVARDLGREVSDLLGVPLAPEEKTNDSPVAQPIAPSVGVSGDSGGARVSDDKPPASADDAHKSGV